jgi:hypothetical protein
MSGRCRRRCATTAAVALPPSPPALTSDEPGLDSAVALSGVCAGDVAGLTALATRVAQQGVALRATALLETIAASPSAGVRHDAALLAAYGAGFAGDAPGAPAPPPRAKPAPPAGALTRSTATGGSGSRPAPLHDRLDGAGTCLEPTADAGVVAHWPPAPVAVPLKPILFDLAFNGLAAYPERLAAAAAAPAPAPAPAARPVAASPAKPAGGGGGATTTPAKPAASAASARVGPGSSAKVGPGAKAAAPASASKGGAGGGAAAGGEQAPASPGSGLLGSAMGWLTGGR